MSTRSRIGSFAGVAFALAGISAFGVSQAGPGAGSPGQPVIDFYVAHRSAALTSDYLWGIAFACFLAFAAALRSRLRNGAEDDTIATLSLVTAGVTTAGATLYFGFDATLAATAGTLTPSAAQALNVLALKMFIPLAVGGLAFGLATGAAIVRSRELPRSLGWSAAVVGLACVSPLGVFAIVLLLLWSAVAGVVMLRRSAPERPRAAAAGA